MSLEELDAKAQELINQAIEENKQKEEKIISKKPTFDAIANGGAENDLNDDGPEKKLTKQTIVVNQNIRRSDSISSSDSDSSPQENSDDEKNEEPKSSKKKKINKKLKSSMTSNDSNLENLMVSEDLYIKYATLISCILCITTISINIIYSLISDRLTLTFSYQRANDKLESILMNYTMIYIFLIVIILFNFGLFFFVLLGSDHMLTKLIYIGLNWYFVLTQLSIGFQFLITLIWDIDLWTINVCLSVSMLSILILAFYFTEIKKKINMSKVTLIFIFIYISILFSFITYITLFNISCILMENVNIEDENSEDSSTLILIVKISIGTIQTILSFVLLTYFKDIFFSFSSGYIICAVIVHLETNFEKKEDLVLLIYVCAIVLGIIIEIKTYKKKVLGYEEVPEEITKDFNNALE